MALVKDAGLSRRDIRGTETRRVEHRPRYDLLAALRRWLPFCADPDPITVAVTEREQGMSEAEVHRWVIYHDEQEEMKSEEAEEEQDRVRRQYGNLGEGGRF